MAVIADLVTRADRGKYVAYASIGMTVAPVLGPVLGGVFTQFLGWRSIFIFLAILATLLAAMILAVMPETCRGIVGNGSIRPQWWNRSCRQRFWPETIPDSRHDQDPSTQLRMRRRPSLWDTFHVMRDPSTALVISAGMLMMSGHMAILVSIPFLFAANYGFNSLHIGLCYLPYAVGGLVARWTVGLLADRNYRRHGTRAGLRIVQNHQAPEELQAIPLERVRLQLTLPFLYASALLVTLYGWLLQARVHLAGVFVLLSLLGNTLTGTQNTLNMLLIDLNAERPAVAIASIALFRSLSGAGVVAATLPVIRCIGVGWAATVIAGFWLTASLALWLVYMYGHQWRESRRDRAG